MQRCGYMTAIVRASAAADGAQIVDGVVSWL